MSSILNEFWKEFLILAHRLGERLKSLGYGSMLEHVFSDYEFWKDPTITACLRKDLTDRGVWPASSGRTLSE
mgnify:CR=1 FL=1